MARARSVHILNKESSNTMSKWKDKYARKPFHRTYTKFAKPKSVKIALVGDSFCNSVKYTPYKTWPYIVAEELNANLVSLGRSGSALLHSYEDLIDIVDEADYIILCVTEPNRIANRFGLPLTMSAKEEDIPDLEKEGRMLDPVFGWKDYWGVTNKQTKNILSGLESYYNYLWDPRIHEIFQRGILMQIDELCMQKNKRCFWFQCFYNSGLNLNYSRSEKELPEEVSKFKPKSGPVGDRLLFSLSMQELISLGLSLDYCKLIINDMWTKKDIAKLRKAGYPDEKRFNHYGSQYNRFFANMILDILNNEDYLQKEFKDVITMSDYFPDERRLFAHLGIDKWIGEEHPEWPLVADRVASDAPIN